MKQADRAIDWAKHATSDVLRRIRAADGVPGVRDEVLGVPCWLYDAHPDDGVQRGAAVPGSVIAQRDGAILRATVDGAVWITHLRAVPEDGVPTLKLPAAHVLGERLAAVPGLPLAAGTRSAGATWPTIRYEEEGDVGVLHFDFYNGAMSAASCRALRDAVLAARARPTRVLVLAGGRDFWSNGLDLNVIEASGQAAEASWANIEAMNDLVLAILEAERQLTVAALQGNAGAGGCFLALAADRVFARSGIVLNPHYKAMGNLYGSEYWTYLLPRRVGASRAAAIVSHRLPITGAQAAERGLVDAAFGASPAGFLAAALRAGPGARRRSWRSPPCSRTSGGSAPRTRRPSRSRATARRNWRA